MPWEKKKVALKLPDPIADVIGEVSGLVSSTEPILTTLTQLLNTAKALYKDGIDPLSAILGTLLDEIEDLINDFFASGFYFLQVDPSQIPSPRYITAKIGDRELTVPVPTLTPRQAISLTISSLDDQGDFNRPKFSDSAQIAGLGILVSAVDVKAFLALLNAVNKLFNISELERFIEKYDKLLTEGIQATNVTEVVVYDEINQATNRISVSQVWPQGSGVLVLLVEGDDLPGELISGSTYFINYIDDGTIELADTAGGPALDITTNDQDLKMLLQPGSLTSLPPDWKSFRLESINAMADVKIILNQCLNQLRGYISIANSAINDAISVYENKLNDLITTVDALQSVLDTLKNLTADGVYVLDIPSDVGGNTRLISELNSLDHSQIINDQFSALILFVAGGPDTAGLDKFKEFLS